MKIILPLVVWIVLFSSSVSRVFHNYIYISYRNFYSFVFNLYKNMFRIYRRFFIETKKIIKFKYWNMALFFASLVKQTF